MSLSVLPLPMGASPRSGTDARGCVVALLEAGIPLSLLLDLAQPDPRSQELYVLESGRD